MIKKIGKKRIIWSLMAVQIAILVIFYILKVLVDDHKLVFVSGYISNPEDWGAGLANVGVHTYNMIILIAVFLLIQVVFWVIYTNKVSMKKRVIG